MCILVEDLFPGTSCINVDFINTSIVFILKSYCNLIYHVYGPENIYVSRESEIKVYKITQLNVSYVPVFTSIY